MFFNTKPDEERLNITLIRGSESEQMRSDSQLLKKHTKIYQHKLIWTLLFILKLITELKSYSTVPHITLQFLWYGTYGTGTYMAVQEILSFWSYNLFLLYLSI